MKLSKQLSAPIASITQKPWEFAIWWLVANIFGLAGIWIPLVCVWIFRRQGTGAALIWSLDNGHLAIFNIVLLAESVAGVFIVVGGGSNIRSAGLRVFFALLAILLTLVECGILVLQHFDNGTLHASIFVQWSFTIVAIALASYLYCFRSPSWEADVAEVKTQDDQAVTELSVAGSVITTDNKGVKL